MSKQKILVMVGGISRGSINKRLFEEVKALTSDRFEFDEVDIAAIPYYSQDDEMDPPPVVKSLKERIRGCDGVLFVTPEYNRGIPGVLKNAIDWASRPRGDNSWLGKPAALMGSTPGGSGTVCAQSNLRLILTEIGVCVMPIPSFYHTADTETGQIDEKTKKYIVRAMNAFAAWIEKINR